MRNMKTISNIRNMKNMTNMRTMTIIKNIKDIRSMRNMKSMKIMRNMIMKQCLEKKSHTTFQTTTNENDNISTYISYCNMFGLNCMHCYNCMPWFLSP